MTRAIQIAGLLLLGAASGLSEQGGAKAPKAAPPPPRAGAVRPNNPKSNAPFKNAGPGARAVPGGPRLPNPLGNPVQRLMAMPPEQRERLGLAFRRVDSRDAPSATMALGQLRGRALPVAAAKFAEQVSKSIDQQGVS